MLGWILFGEIIGQVVLSYLPIHQVVSLSHPLAYPIKSHINCYWFMLSYIIVHKTVSGCAVYNYWCWWLVVDHFFHGIIRVSPCWHFKNNALSSASIMISRTLFICCAFHMYGSIEGGGGGSLDLTMVQRGSDNPRICFFPLVPIKNDASLCMCNVIPLTWYLMMALAWVAA